MKQVIRFCTAADGVQIAYSIIGQGPPLVRVIGWFTHLEYEWQSPFWRTYNERFSDHYTLIRYDGRGMGLSDREVPPLTPESFLMDVEAVVEASGFDKVTINGLSQGGGASVSYAVKHPEKTSNLVLYGTFGRIYTSDDELTMMQTLVRMGWGSDVPAHRQFFTNLFMPDSPSMEDIQTFTELQKVSATPEFVASFVSYGHEGKEAWDVFSLLPQVKVPALVMHRRNDAIVPFEEGRAMAARMPTARFLPLEGANHAVLATETAVWNEIVEAVDKLILGETPTKPAAGPSSFRTVLFTDLVGHTVMMQRLGDDKGRELLREHERITRETLKANGGTEVKTMGDGFMASFGSVTKAVECAVALQRAFAGREGEALSIRVGLNAGEPIEEDGDLFGATVILASRIAAKAQGGEILVADTVRGLCSGKGFLFADRGEFVAKGFEEPVRVSEVSWRSSKSDG
jgi:class 3 adenylate cyclase